MNFNLSKQLADTNQILAERNQLADINHLSTNSYKCKKIVRIKNFKGCKRSGLPFQ
jgi:hypothetical protein